MDITVKKERRVNFYTSSSRVGNGRRESCTSYSKSDEQEDRALHGLTRALLQNMVTGVNEGFSIRFEIIGVGYRTQIVESKITLSFGFSHPGDDIWKVFLQKSDKDTKHLVLSGIDKRRLVICLQKFVLLKTRTL